MRSLKRVQSVALWTLAQTSMMTQSDFLQILEKGGPSAVIAECVQNGALKPLKPSMSEVPFERMLHQEYYTSNRLFYTFSHSRTPLVDIRNWKLTVEGDGVDNPFSLNYDDLLKLPVTTVTRCLECAGNGSAFYAELLNKPAQGPQWRFGGWGIAEWTGVRLSELLGMARIKKEAVEVMPVGVDDPHGERPMPVEKAMEEDTLLAYIMNGQILPADHGFPLRALLAGWVGVSSIKWVNRVIISTKPIHVATNTTSFVLIGPDYQPQPPARGPAVTTQLMKSACCLPWNAVLKPGHNIIAGYAWSPFGKIAGVDVSIDGGNRFIPADLKGPNIEKAGTRWEFHFHAEPGAMTITPRATDDKGNVQYDVSKQKWNQLGYLFGAMVPHPVKVSASKGKSYSGEDESVITPAEGCC